MLASDLSRALDPVLLARDAGIEPDPWQADLLRTMPRRALLLCSRQSGKSTVTSLIALHTAIYQPGALVLLVSPSQRQSGELFRTCIGFHSRLAGAPALSAESALRAELANGSRIIALPGSERTIRGYAGADLVVIDEAARVEDDLLAAVRPMLATTDGNLIALTTPAGKRGWFYEAWHSHEGTDWTRIKVAASDCPRISPEFLAEELRELGAMRFSEPISAGVQGQRRGGIPDRDHCACLHLGGRAPMELRAGFFEEHVEERFVVGIDLGQSTDPTAVCVLQHRRVHQMHPNGRFVGAAAETFDVRHLQRLPLGLSYPAQVDAVADLLARPPLNGRCELIIDETGVGRAVGDLFDVIRVKPTRVSITAGSEQSPAGLRRWHVPKSTLVSMLDARLHTGELRFAAELQEADAMAEELKDFRRKVSVAGRYSYDARVGKHDDLVLAVALALWAVTGRPKPPVAQTGTFRWMR